jgi:circadian clock protein KaiC
MIRTGGLEVFPRLVAAEHHRGFAAEPLRSGVKEIDDLLGGGLDRGTSALFMGPAGSGKSTIASQFLCAAAKNGEKSAVFTFDESVATLLRRAEGLGMDVRACIDSGKISIQQVDPGELSPGEFIYTIRRAVEKDGVKVVVIDSLNGYLNAMPEERFLTIQLHELLTYLGQQGVVTIMIVAQQGLLGSSMQTPVDASYLADTVVALRYFEAGGKIRRAISVIKKRSGPHEDRLRELTLSNRGLCVGEPLDKYHGVFTGVPTPLQRPPETNDARYRDR